jgi:hypothetical protein
MVHHYILSICHSMGPMSSVEVGSHIPKAMDEGTSFLSHQKCHSHAYGIGP